MELFRINNDIVNVKDNIYLSNYYTASNINIIRQFNIKHIINLSNRTLINEKNIKSYCDIINFKVDDIEIIYKSSYFEYVMNSYIEIIDFMSKTKENILINCYAGINRSVLLICMYLCYKYKCTPYKAYNFLKFINYHRNKTALNNLSFHLILNDYHKNI
jgi:protein-tyrosine phosphatase